MSLLLYCNEPFIIIINKIFMSESAKVQLKIVCPFCKDMIFLNKKKEISKKIIECPSCKKQLKVIFNVDVTPQTYKVLIDANSSEKKENPTIYKKDKDYNKKNNDTDEYGDDYYENECRQHCQKNDFCDDDEYIEKPVKSKKHFRGRAFLTHMRCLGLYIQRYPLYEGKTIVGRYDLENPSDIAIKGDSMMSRKSIAINIEEEDGVFVVKLKVLRAANPVKVNDIQIKEGHSTYIDDGDIILLGKSKFKFENQ